MLALEKTNGDYEKKMRLPERLQEDFKWWMNNIKVADNSINNFHYSMEIFSDACLSG